MPTVTKKYYHNIDLDNNQLINAVVENLATAPTSPVDGQIYYNTVDKKIYYYNSTTTQWGGVGSAATLYTDNGTLTSDRVVSAGGFTLTLNPKTFFDNGVTFNATTGNVGTFINTQGYSTISTQLYFYPNSGTNVAQTLNIIPRGTGYNSVFKAQFSVYNTDTIADPSNTEFVTFRAAGSLFTFASGKFGTGVIRPLMFSAGYATDSATNINQLYLNTAGGVTIGGTNSDGYKLDVQGNFRTSSYAYINYNGLDGLYIDKSQIFRNYYGNYFGKIDFTGFTIPNESTVGVRIAGWDATAEALHVIRDQAASRNVTYIGSNTLNVNRSAAFIVDSTTRGAMLPKMTATQRQNIGGVPSTVGTITGGSGYPNGTYTNVQAQGGNGFNMTLNVTISGGSVTSVSYNTVGDGYRTGDVITFYYLTALATSGGTGFSFVVGTVVIPSGVLVYQTDGTEGLYQYKSTGWSLVSPSLSSYLTVNNPTYTGILKTGIVSYTPSAALATLQSSEVGYNQFVLQNSNSGSFSSSDFVVSTDLSTDSAYYGDFGMNSSQFAGTGSFALPNAIYLYGSDGDLVLGTVTANDVHIVTDSSDVDSITVLTSGQILFPHYTTNTSFTGTAAGIIGFTADGELITLDASAIGSGTVTSVEIAAGTGISLSGTNPITSSGIITVTNSAPDQVVTLTANTGITVEGTYPSFNLINDDKGSSQNIFKNIAVNAQTTITAGSNNETLTVTAGTGVSVTTNNTTKTLTITNSAPDQAVSLTAGTATTISGTYPNFTIGASYTPVNKAGDTMLGNLTLVGSPTNVLHAATKQYVDEQTSAGLHIHEPVRAETPTALTATYTNGGTTHTVTAVATNDTLTIGTHSLLANDVIVFNSTLNGITSGVAYFVYDAPSSTSIRLSDTYGGNVISSLTNGTGLNITSRANAGVGATLTNAGAQAALVIDGVILQVGNRVMIRQQVNAYENGVYVVTNVGSGSTNWVLTRSSDANKYSPADTMTLGGGDYFFTSEGLVMAGDSHVLTTTGVIIFGTTNLTFEQFSGAVTYTGGTNITVTGQTIALTGQVAVANGGTGASTLTGVLVGDGTNPVSGVTGTASQLLRRNSGNTAYEFFSPTYTTRTLSIVSANTTAAAVANTDYVYLVSGTSIITLPTAVGNTSKYTIKNTGTNTVTVNTTSSQTIDGSTSINLAVRYTALEFISDGSNWNII